MLSLIEAADDALPPARQILNAAALERQPLSRTKFLAPIPRRPQIRDFLVFHKHLVGAPIRMAKLANRLNGLPAAVEVKTPLLPEIYRTKPVFYFSDHFNMVGPDAEIRWPSYSQYLNFELRGEWHRGAAQLTSACVR